MSLSTHKPLISRKSGTLLKHQYLLWFKHIGASGSRLISIPKSLKNQPRNHCCHQGGPSHEKVGKMTPKWSPRATSNRSKINKNRHLDTTVPQWVAQGTPGRPKWWPRVPKWCLRVPTGHPRVLKWSLNGRCRYPKSPCPVICQSCQSCHSSQSCQLPVNWLPEGPAAGAKP